LIEKRQRRDRKGRTYTVYRVRWKDDAGREHSKTLPRGTKKDEAEDFERRVMTIKRAGALAQLDRGKQPLKEFVPEWWETYASPNLTRETLRRYAEVWNAHVLPRLGHYRLTELTPEVVSRFGAELQRAGVGANTRHKALTFLSGVLRTAVEWGRVPTNPVRDVRKPTVRRQRPVRPLSPEQVEALRGELDPVSASYVGVLAYAGPRPGEGLRLLWRDVGEQTLLFDVTKTRALPPRAAARAPAPGPWRAPAPVGTPARRRERLPGALARPSQLQQLAQARLLPGGEARGPAGGAGPLRPATHLRIAAYLGGQAVDRRDRGADGALAADVARHIRARDRRAQRPADGNRRRNPPGARRLGGP
jgi:hypothetical protein